MYFGSKRALPHKTIEKSAFFQNHSAFKLQNINNVTTGDKLFCFLMECQFSGNVTNIPAVLQPSSTCQWFWLLTVCCQRFTHQPIVLLRCEANAYFMAYCKRWRWICKTWICKRWICKTWICKRWICKRWICKRWICKTWICKRWICKTWICKRWICKTWICKTWICERWICKTWIFKRWICKTW